MYRIIRRFNGVLQTLAFQNGLRNRPQRLAFELLSCYMMNNSVRTPVHARLGLECVYMISRLSFRYPLLSCICPSLCVRVYLPPSLIDAVVLPLHLFRNEDYRSPSSQRAVMRRPVGGAAGARQ